MISSIENFLNDLFDGQPKQIADDEEERIACAALLVHCANADGLRSPAEDERLRQILKEHFKLSPGEIDRVVATAEQREADAVDIHRFTRVLHGRLDREGRQRMVKWLWEVANADGVIDGNERHTVSLTAQLLDVEVRDSVALRQAAEREGN
ncbi:MAG: TerB family tellurite resistance protein [Pseudomonadota bacterium]